MTPSRARSSGSASPRPASTVSSSPKSTTDSAPTPSTWSLRSNSSVGTQYPDRSSKRSPWRRRSWPPLHRNVSLLSPRVRWQLSQLPRAHRSRSTPMRWIWFCSRRTVPYHSASLAKPRHRWISPASSTRFQPANRWAPPTSRPPSTWALLPLPRSCRAWARHCSRSPPNTRSSASSSARSSDSSRP